MQRRLEPEQQADRSRCDLAGHRQAGSRSPRRWRRADRATDPAPPGSARPRSTRAGPIVRPWLARSRTRRRSRRSPTPPAAPLGRSSPEPRRCPTSSRRSARSEGVGSPRLLRWLRVREVVNPSAPARTAPNGELRHLGDVVLGRRFTTGASVTHHVQTQCTVRHLRRHIDVETATLERVEVLRERTPTPR